MENDDNVVVDLKESVQILKKQVDVLEISARSQQSLWYKNLPTIISVIALLFSFGTTYVSYTRSGEQDKQNMRGELRGLLQRLSGISRDQVEMPKKFSDDSVTVMAISGLLGQENALLSRQAAELARKLPKDSVSSTEYSSIATSMMNGFNYAGAKEFFGYAIDSAKDFNDKINAQRSQAHLLFMMGQPEAGRNEYQKALDIFSTFIGYDDFTKKATNMQTELAWAYSESGLGSKDQANAHLERAEEYVSSLSPGPGTNLLRTQVAQSKARINAPTTLINPLPQP